MFWGHTAVSLVQRLLCFPTSQSTTAVLFCAPPSWFLFCYLSLGRQDCFFQKHLQLPPLCYSLCLDLATFHLKSVPSAPSNFTDNLLGLASQPCHSHRDYQLSLGPRASSLLSFNIHLHMEDRSCPSFLCVVLLLSGEQALWKHAQKPRDRRALAFSCVYMQHSMQEPKEASSPGTGVTGSWELPGGN